MKRLLLWVIDHPVPAAGLIALLTVLFAIQIPPQDLLDKLGVQRVVAPVRMSKGLEIDTSAEGLMVEKDPARDYYEQVKQKFGSDSLTIVLVKADDVFAAPALQVIKRISDALERVEGVSRVESLTTVNNIKGEGDALNTDSLVGAVVPTAPADLERIRGDALGNRVFVGNIVSKDAKATAINVYTETKPGDKQFNQRFSDRVEALIKQETAPGLTIYQIGSPLTKKTFGEYIQQDQINLIPISLGVLLVILFLAFRMLQGVVVPIVTGVTSIVWGLGLMAIFGLPVNVITAIIPSLLIAIGFTEDVHMLSEYHHLLEQGKDKLTAIRTMIQQSALPILITTITTVLGFGSLITTDITMLIQFGWASALGLTANFIVTVVVLPIMLKVWPVPKRIRAAAFEDEAAHGAIPRMMQRLGEFNLRYRGRIAIATGLVVIGSLIGWYTLKVNTDFISYFPERSFIRQRTKDLHESLAGVVNFYVVVETGREDGAKDPDLLRKIADLQEFLAGTGQIDKTVSMADYIRKMHREMNGGDPAFEVIPDTREQVAQYLLTLEGKELAKYVDFNASTANLVVRHNITSSWELSALLQRLDAFIPKTFPQGVKVRYSGETILINNAADYMAINEITSFSSTFIIIGLIHALLFMSLRAGFLSLIPNVIPILTNFGLMGLLGIPLNTGTALIATIAIGIAVDDTVHHMVTYSRQLKEHHDQKIAMFNTMKAQGRPIIYVSLALAGGFFVLVFSNFVPTFYFGVLSALVMLVAMVGEMVLTPILMYSTRLVTLWDMVLLKLRYDVLQATPLFAGFSRWEIRKIVLLGGLREYGPDEYIIRKGERGTEMYMVVQGRVRITDAGPDGAERTLAVFRPGMVFGEVAAVGGGARVANVIAEEATTALRLDWPVLERVRVRFPYTGAKLFRNVARVLAERLSGGRPPAESPAQVPGRSVSA
jgi:hydrophobe/amphiphile efflux-3 (HAE3) family protein